MPRGTRLLFSLLLALALLAAAGCDLLRAGPLAQVRPTSPPPTSTSKSLSAVTQAPPALTRPSQVEGLPNIADIVARVRPAVVSIAARAQNRDLFRQPIRTIQSGTGVIFDPRGYIVTNNHVIEGSQRILVTLDDDRSYEGQVIGTDPLTDLAILKIGSQETFPHLTFADPDSVHIGDWVIAIGNALALPGGPTVTLGVVGALDRSIRVRDQSFFDLVQTDAAINEGNSGGPLLNLRGEVVGINTIVVTEAQGIGFAISSFTVGQVVQSILQHGRVVWPWMGVGLDDVTPGKALELGLSVREGILVTSVAPGSPAARAGMKAGDIFTTLGAQPVATIRQLQKALREGYAPGQEVQVTYLRDGKKQTTSLTLIEAQR